VGIFPVVGFSTPASLVQRAYLLNMVREEKLGMSEAFWNKRGGCKSVDKKKKKVTGK
jgi:hypothetical protein